MDKKVTRKCSVCKEPISIYEETDDFFIEEKNGQRKFYHCDCYIKKETTKKRAAKTIQECKEYISECREKKKVSELKAAIKEEFFNYIIDMYGLGYVPKYMYVRFSEVFNGTYKGLSKPVPPEDLLEMWKQKRNYLFRVAEQNRKKGKQINGISCVWYDLAILLSKYDSYLEWKEQQKIALVETEEKKKEKIEFVEYKDISKKQATQKENNKIDIYSMLDEI